MHRAKTGTITLDDVAELTGLDICAILLVCADMQI